MTGKPPRILIPGLRTKTGVQPGPGILVGRPRGGRGQLQLLRPQDLLGMGITRPGNKTDLHEAGFTFQVNGVPSDNEFVGQGSWSKDITFRNSDPNNSVKSLIAATGTPQFRMLTQALGSLGHIAFTAGGTTGTVVWDTDPYIHPAGQLMLLYCPTTHDATLASINGRVVGYWS